MRIGAAAALAAFYGFLFLPAGVLVAFSLQSGRLPAPPFDGPSLKWHAAVWADRDLTAALLNSLGVAALSSAVATALGFLAARGLGAGRLPGAGAVRALLIAPIAVSYLVIGLGLLVWFDLIGMPRSLLAVGIGHVVINLPLCVTILAAAIGEPQRAAERAARDLGASEWRVMRHVTAPMVAPSLAAAFLLSATFSWDEFVIAFLLTRFDVTLPVEIWSLMRGGLSPKTNAAGATVFLISVAAVAAAEIALMRRAR